MRRDHRWSWGRKGEGGRRFRGLCLQAPPQEMWGDDRTAHEMGVGAGVGAEVRGMVLGESLRLGLGVWFSGSAVLSMLCCRDECCKGLEVFFSGLLCVPSA